MSSVYISDLRPYKYWHFTDVSKILLRLDEPSDLFYNSFYLTDLINPLRDWVVKGKITISEYQRIASLIMDAYFDLEFWVETGRGVDRDNNILFEDSVQIVEDLRDNLDILKFLNIPGIIDTPISGEEKYCMVSFDKL